MKQTTSCASCPDGKQIGNADRRGKKRTNILLTFAKGRAEFLDRTFSQHWDLFCLDPYSPVVMPAGDTYRLLEQQQKICQNRGSKWGTQIGEEREEGLIFIWCLNCAQRIGEHYIYVISLQVALIMWLDYILKT